MGTFATAIVPEPRSPREDSSKVWRSDDRYLGACIDPRAPDRARDDFVAAVHVTCAVRGESQAGNGKLKVSVNLQ